MLKRLVLIVPLAAALGLAVVGCGGDNASTDLGSQPDMAVGGGNNPDMAFTCVSAPMMDPDFLNSCAPDGVDKVDIMPFYPSLAPNGVLPPLP